MIINPIPFKAYDVWQETILLKSAKIKDKN